MIRNVERAPTTSSVRAIEQRRAVQALRGSSSPVMRATGSMGLECSWLAKHEVRGYDLAPQRRSQPESRRTREQHVPTSRTRLQPLGDRCRRGPPTRARRPRRARRGGRAPLAPGALPALRCAQAATDRARPRPAHRHRPPPPRGAAGHRPAGARGDRRRALCRNGRRAGGGGRGRDRRRRLATPGARERHAGAADRPRPGRRPSRGARRRPRGERRLPRDAPKRGLPSPRIRRRSGGARAPARRPGRSALSRGSPGSGDAAGRDPAYGRRVDATAASGTRQATGEPAFGAGHLFLADSRMALALLNYARYRTLERWFGVPREHANIVTLVLALGAADAAYETTRRIVGAPLLPSPVDAAIGAIGLRDAALAVAGPADRSGPLVGSLLAFAVAGGLALPVLRQMSGRLRATENRLREQRIGRYRAATRSAGG